MPVIVFDVPNEVVVVSSGLLELLREPLPFNAAFASVLPKGRSGHGRFGIELEAVHFCGSAEVAKMGDLPGAILPGTFCSAEKACGGGCWSCAMNRRVGSMKVLYTLSERCVPMSFHGQSSRREVYFWIGASHEVEPAPGPITYPRYLPFFAHV